MACVLTICIFSLSLLWLGLNYKYWLISFICVWYKERIFGPIATQDKWDIVKMVITRCNFERTNFMDKQNEGCQH